MNVRNRRRRAFRKGHHAEGFAALWLRFKGYRILARRFRCRVGEVDIIARRGAVLAVVEVKARNEVTAAVDAVQNAAWRRIEAAADVWRGRHPQLDALSTRYDIVAVTSAFRLRHLAGAWQPVRYK
ncbi:YraN family protein [Aureimonas altamirensis]|uniref:YraN family protein n=1 Tax=Aureimonas altamirensis TaxID=370622 RepID=UPI002036B05A|nr:YraN family protein [Aureimonas altamirensis]MCM2504015.1 YraN family protein [Aureimonas altamirensis]